LRKAIGFIGLLLPVVLALVKIALVFVSVCCDQPGIETSISAYYYTRLGNVFVGSLCAIGIFLMSYRGFDRRDEIAGKIAGTLAICVAMFPTSPRDIPAKTAAVHLTSAALLFLTLAYFSIVLFRQMDPKKPPTPQKLMRNKI
jgi:cytochrome c biogenesis factor